EGNKQFPADFNFASPPPAPSHLGAKIKTVRRSGLNISINSEGKPLWLAYFGQGHALALRFLINF
ncbi:MAG: hypothetical protein ACP5Q3_15310, partial [bacterium]